MNYYVYAYIRIISSKYGRAGTPYYIGKGSGDRAFTYHDNIRIPKDKSRIIIIENTLSEIGALALERRLIRWWGRKEYGGHLVNRTDGGDGASGYKFTDEQRARCSKPGALNGMFGKTHSTEVKNKAAKRWAATNKKRNWYNNSSESKFCEVAPDGWVRGRLLNLSTKGFKWYNDGSVNKTALEHPGAGWCAGMLR